jgi:pimeloyl-ACP methyl ester carboxylesterase
MIMHSITYHFATIDGRKVFYREAGDPARPAIILLHGFPTSSHMYRDLIRLLADTFRFGNSGSAVCTVMLPYQISDFIPT